MKKLTLILMLFSICTLASAQGVRGKNSRGRDARNAARTTSKPTISNIVCPHSNKTIYQNYTSISATIGNVPGKENIQLTLNDRKIPFTYKERRLSASVKNLTPGNNFLEILVRNASGTHSIRRNVHYSKPKPPPVAQATGIVTIKLESSKCNGHNYYVILEDMDNKDNRIEIWFDGDCKVAKEVPTGRYKVHFNLRYTDAGCDSCENPAKIKRVNTNCADLYISLGKNKTASLSCYRL